MPINVMSANHCPRNSVLFNLLPVTQDDLEEFMALMILNVKMSLMSIIHLAYTPHTYTHACVCATVFSEYI